MKGTRVCFCVCAVKDDRTCLPGCCSDPARVVQFRGRLFELSSPFVFVFQGQLRVNGRAGVAFDPNGIVFAVSSGQNIVRLYDTRHIDQVSLPRGTAARRCAARRPPTAVGPAPRRHLR